MAQKKTQPSLEEIQKSYFSQLRSLCRDVEKGIEDLKQEPDSSSTSTNSEDSVCAKNMILHTTKELKDLKIQAQAQYKDFVINSSRFLRIQELMQDLFKVYWKRIESVELFIEKYGYERPANSNSHQEFCENMKGSENMKDETDSELESAPVDAESQFNSSFDQKENANPEQSNLQMTPPKNQESIDKLSHASALKTPEPPAFLSFLNQRQFNEGLKGNVIDEKTQVTASQINNKVGHAPHLSTPETPEHIRTILIGSTTKSKPQTRQVSAFPFGHASHLSTPETPEQIRTILINSTTKSKPETRQVDAFPLSTPDHVRTKITSSIAKSQAGTNPLVPAPLTTPETPDNLQTIVGSMKKSKPDTILPLPVRLSTPDPPDIIRTVMSSMEKQRPNMESSLSSQFATPEMPDNLRTLIGSMKKTTRLDMN